MHKFLFLTLFTFLFSQAEITNIQASMRTNGSGIIDISYDLLPDPVFDFFEITLECSVDGGQSWSLMNNISGEYGDIIQAGNNKQITWNFRNQFGETFTDQLQIKINGYSVAIIDNNDNQELPFEMVTIPSGEYTFGVNNEIKAIEYDYEIMKYEVTDYDYVLFMLDKLDNANVEECEDYEGCFNIPGSYDSCLSCDEIEEAVNVGWGSIEYYCSNFVDNFSTADDACCICGGGSSSPLDIFYLYDNKAFGYYPGDVNTPAGNYSYINFAASKISWNGEIFEVEEGNINHPVTGVTWFGAWAFATYYGMEIPDQYEWEKAARGNTGYQWPSGNTFTTENGNIIGSLLPFYNLGGPTTPVGTFNGNTYECSSEAYYSGSLFFSEYAEGSGSNKYLEIYNPTNETVSLGYFSLSSCSNGCNEPGVWDYPDNVTFTGDAYIEPGDVYIVCSQSASDEIISECDQTFTYLSNGDDAFGLTNLGATITYDIIGTMGDDPGYGWDVGGIENGTKDHTLIRKPFVFTGNGGGWEQSAASEWDVFEQNYWQDIGMHITSYDYIDDDTEFDCDDMVTIDSPSPYGLYDMAGNVWEIVQGDTNQPQFLKGGSWFNNANEASSWYYEAYDSNSSSTTIGFRCIRKINETNRKIIKKKINNFEK